MFLELEKLFSGSLECIFLDSESFRMSGLEVGDEITLWAGANKHQVKVLVLDSSEAGKVYLSEDVYKNLNLPSSHKLTALLKPEEKLLQIGPFLGFLIVRKRNSKIPPYSSQRVILEMFSAMALKRGVIPFVFAPQDIDWTNQTIAGHTLQKTSGGTYQWITDIFPFPNAAYNRILTRTLEHKELIKETVIKLNAIPDLHHFNPKFLEKWETHEILSSYPPLSPYLPETARVRRLSDIAEIAGKHPTIYIKPINGSLGNNILKLMATPDGYLYQYRKKRKNHTGLWEDPQTLWTEMRQILGKRQYIVQQGLEFRKYQGRVFDIRLLLQKDGRGDWTPTAIVGRVAAKNSIFPNIAAGGEAKRIEEIWQEISSEAWEESQVFRQVLDIGYKAAHALEKELGDFAELGLDIGVDTKDRAWLIEVNSKPSRKVFPKQRPDLKMNSIRNIIDYSKYVAGFAISHHDSGEQP